MLANLDHEMEKRLEQIRVESEKTVNATHLDDKTRLEVIAEKSRLITSSVSLSTPGPANMKQRKKVLSRCTEYSMIFTIEPACESRLP